MARRRDTRPSDIINRLREVGASLAPDGGPKTLFIEPGSPWEKGYRESFNDKFREYLLERDIFYTLKAAEALVEQWKGACHRIRPHRIPGYRRSVPETTSILGRIDPGAWLSPSCKIQGQVKRAISYPTDAFLGLLLQRTRQYNSGHEQNLVFQLPVQRVYAGGLCST